MKNKLLICLLLFFVISIIFPIKSNLIKSNYNSLKTAIELKDEVYTFKFKVDGNNFSMMQFRFTNFDTDIHKSTIHYKLLDQDNNVIFEKSEKTSEIKTNEYRQEYFNKQTNSKNKYYTFMVYYDEYFEDETFGIWVSSKSSSDNYLQNDNRYGLELYTKRDVANITFSWLILISIVITYSNSVLRKDYK